MCGLRGSVRLNQPLSAFNPSSYPSSSPAGSSPQRNSRQRGPEELAVGDLPGLQTEIEPIPGPVLALVGEEVLQRLAGFSREMLLGPGVVVDQRKGVEDRLCRAGFGDFGRVDVVPWLRCRPGPHPTPNSSSNVGAWPWGSPAAVQKAAPPEGRGGSYDRRARRGGCRSTTLPAAGDNDPHPPRTRCCPVATLRASTTSAGTEASGNGSDNGSGNGSDNGSGNGPDEVPPTGALEHERKHIEASKNHLERAILIVFDRSPVFEDGATTPLRNETCAGPGLTRCPLTRLALPRDSVRRSRSESCARPGCSPGTTLLGSNISCATSHVNPACKWRSLSSSLSRLPCK